MTTIKKEIEQKIFREWISDAFYEILRNHGKRQKEIAAEMKTDKDRISTSRLSHYKSGSQTIPKSFVIRLAKKYGLELPMHMQLDKEPREQEAIILLREAEDLLTRMADFLK